MSGDPGGQWGVIRATPQLSTREQYEARKLQLEEERQAAIELVQASYNTQLRALEMVWMSFSGEPVATPSPAPPPPPPAAAPDPASAAPQKPPRPRPDQIYEDVNGLVANPRNRRSLRSRPPDPATERQREVERWRKLLCASWLR